MLLHVSIVCVRSPHISQFMSFSDIFKQKSYPTQNCSFGTYCYSIKKKREGNGITQATTSHKGAKLKEIASQICLPV